MKSFEMPVEIFHNRHTDESNEYEYVQIIEILFP